jgi:hypothetical protein
MRKLLLALSLLLLPTAVAPLAHGDAATITETWQALDAEAIALQTSTTTVDGKLHSVLKVQALDAKLATKGKPASVYDGPYVLGTLAVRTGSAAVAMFRGGGGPFVKVGLVDLAAGTSKVVELTRTAPAGYTPTSLVATGDAEGFTILWQEQALSIPGSVHSTMARVKADGTFLKKPTTVGVEWALGAIVSNGSGYTLAVRYEGASPDQARICFVTLDANGKPQQHPWWGSRLSQIGEIQLVNVGGVVMAAYRASTAGKESILSVEANSVTGSWGKEPPEAKVLASKDVTSPFTVRAKTGALELVRK